MYYLGVDLGGTNIAVGVVSEEGKLLYKDSVPTLRERSYTEVLKDLAGICKKVIQDFNISEADVKSIGIGSPGVCDNKRGVIVYANNINFENTPVREELQKYINLPIYIGNDANCAALGESAGGAAKGYANSITITLGTGVGGGAVVDNKIFTGSHFVGAEVGHHVINVNGELCTCGRKGCWEAYASATALIRDTKKAAQNNPESKIVDIVNGDLDKINAKTAFDAADLGDETAKQLIKVYLKNVAEGLVNMINIFDPEIVVIGGGVCAQGDNILIPLKEIIKGLIYGGNVLADVVIAKLGNDAGIIGAAMLQEE